MGLCESAVDQQHAVVGALPQCEQQHPVCLSLAPSPVRTVNGIPMSVLRRELPPLIPTLVAVHDAFKRGLGILHRTPTLGDKNLGNPPELGVQHSEPTFWFRHHPPPNTRGMACHTGQHSRTNENVSALAVQPDCQPLCGSLSSAQNSSGCLLGRSGAAGRGSNLTRLRSF